MILTTRKFKKFAIAAVTLSMVTVGILQINAASAENTNKKLTSPQAAALKDWTSTLSLQAASWGAPLVTMYALRHNDSVGPKAKAAPNDIWRMEDISTPTLSKEAGYVTPNVNVLYGFGFMDLRQEPIILEVPDSNNLYYMVEIVDMWTNAFAYAGGKTTGYKGGEIRSGGAWLERRPADGNTAH